MTKEEKTRDEANAQEEINADEYGDIPFPMPIPWPLSQRIISKLNVKSALLFLTFLLFSAGIYMCFLELQSTGTIDIKSTFVEGKITTGSVGLLVIFLGIPVALAAMKISLQGKTVEIIHKDLKVSAANMDEHEWRNILDIIRFK